MSNAQKTSLKIYICEMSTISVPLESLVRNFKSDDITFKTIFSAGGSAREIEERRGATLLGCVIYQVLFPAVSVACLSLSLSLSLGSEGE